MGEEIEEEMEKEEEDVEEDKEEEESLSCYCATREDVSVGEAGVSHLHLKSKW